MSGSTYSDVLTTNALPDAMRVVYSNILEFTARPMLVFNQPQFVEPWEEFGLRRGATVTRTVLHQLPRAIKPLVQNQDITAGSAQDHQVSLTIQEYGSAEGTTEFLDLLSYFGPLSSIVKTLLGPQMALSLDSLAKNAFWYAPNINGGAGPTYKSYANNPARTSRASLQSSDNLTADMARAVAFRMNVRRVPVLGDQQPAYLGITHPSAIYDLQGDANWKNANLYAGAQRIFNGEVGMINGVRFVQTDQARIANGGNIVVQTTLAAGTYTAGTNSVIVTSATTFAVGQEVTLHATGTSTTFNSNTWVAPDGRDPVEETLIIASISGTTITFTTKLLFTHLAGEYMTEAADIYPIIFLGGVQPLAQGVALPPEVRVALPTDILRRMIYVGWYGVLGFGVARDWSYEMLEVQASQSAPLVYGV